jgi:hypothetical protein
MLNLKSRFLTARRISSAACRLFVLTLAWGIGTAPARVLAQAQKTAAPEPPAETGTWPILDWLIVAVLIVAALFVICRSSRRN